MRNQESLSAPATPAIRLMGPVTAEGGAAVTLPRSRQWTRATWSAIGGTALLYLVFIALRLWTNGFDPSFFVQAGDWYADPARVPANLHLLAHKVGYDGQAYYHLALDPWTSQATGYGLTFDNPPYRQQRIFYPLLVWVASFGQVGPVPAMLIVINFAALCLMAGIGTQYARLLGRPPIVGALFACYPGFVITLSGDLTEIVACTALLGALFCLRQRRFSAATVALTAAILARETAEILAISCLLYWLFSKLRGRAVPFPLAVIIIPLLVEVAWQLFLWTRWGVLPLKSSGNQGNLPLQGFASLLYYIPSHPFATTGLQAAGLLVLGFFTATSLLILRHTAALPYERLSWVLYVAMAFTLNHEVWLDSNALLRVFSEVYILGTILLLGSRWRWTLHAFIPPALLWVGVFALWSVGGR